jgi:Putative adhesin
MNDYPQDPYTSRNAFSPYQRRRRYQSSGCCLGWFITFIILGFVAFILTITIPAVDILHLFHVPITGTGANTIFKVNSYPTLIIDSGVSSSSTFENQDKAPIHIQAVATDQKITLNAGNVATDPNDGGNTDVILYSQTQDGSITTLQVRSGYIGNINISVPAQTNLKISTLDSSVMVTGVTGQIVLQSNSGPLTVQNSTLIAGSILNDNSGAIQVEQSTLDGPVTLDNNSGPVTFNGRLNARGNYRLIDNSGNIDVTLSSEDAFHLDAVVNSGTISAEFPGITGTSTAVHGDVGGSGRAQLSLNDNNGSIKIQKA